MRNLFFDVVVEAVKSQKIIIFVNALNEAGDEMTNDLVDYFYQLNDSSNDEKNAIKICIFCRYYSIVIRIFELEISIQKNNHDDIEFYVQNEISFKFQIENLSKTNTRRKLENDIVNKASKIFQ